MQQENNQEIVGQDDEDLEDLPDLFHKSSLRERLDPKLEPFSLQTYQLNHHLNLDNKEMYNQYQVCQKLGEGAFGAVYKGKFKDQYFALKFCSTYGLQKQRFFAPDGQFANSMDLLENQLNIVKRLNHKNIGKCYEIMYSSQKIITVMQLGNLGQLMNWDQSLQKYYRNQKIVSYFSQKYKTNDLGDITRIIFLQISEAVKYLHDNDITNRDIKVDNMICKQTQNIGDEMKLIDFTTVRYKPNDDISFFTTGTPGFRSPQHQFAGSNGYSCKKSDIWSLGYCIYVFYYENMPFYADNDYQMDNKALNEPLTFTNDCPEVLIHVINQMTKKQQKQRITIEEVIEILSKH